MIGKITITLKVDLVFPFEEVWKVPGTSRMSSLSAEEILNIPLRAILSLSRRSSTEKMGKSGKIEEWYPLHLIGTLAFVSSASLCAARTNLTKSTWDGNFPKIRTSSSSSWSSGIKVSDVTSALSIGLEEDPSSPVGCEEEAVKVEAVEEEVEVEAAVDDGTVEEEVNIDAAEEAVDVGAVEEAVDVGGVEEEVDVGAVEEEVKVEAAVDDGAVEVAIDVGAVEGAVEAAVDVGAVKVAVDEVDESFCTWSWKKCFFLFFL